MIKQNKIVTGKTAGQDELTDETASHLRNK